MSVFHSRSSGYKVGVVLLFVAAILYVLGYATPFWYEANVFNYGLWMSCIGQECHMMPAASANYPAWLYAARTLESVCLIGLLTSCVYCVITNCCRSVPTRRTRFLEVVSAVSGHIGFMGCMVFVGGIYGRARQDTLSWSVFMSAFGSALSVFAAITIFVCNKPSSPPVPRRQPSGLDIPRSRSRTRSRSRSRSGRESRRPGSTSNSQRVHWWWWWRQYAVLRQSSSVRPSSSRGTSSCV